MRQPKLLRGQPLAYPERIGQRYHAELQVLVNRMTRDVRKELTALFKGQTATEYFAMDDNLASQARILLNLLSKRQQSLFDQYASQLAQRMLGRVNAESKARLRESFKQLAQGVTLKVSDMPGRMQEIFTASINANVDLIKSIPSQYLEQVKGSVMRSITSANGGLGPLIDDLQKYDGISARRAKMIALNETRHAYNAVNIERTLAAGVTEGIWIHTGGTKEPRPKHKAYNGKVFKLAEGAPVGDNGEYVMPGTEINCVPGNTLIKNSHGLNKLYRRLYKGKLANIITRNKASIVMTPNHPVLTQRGWIAASEVKRGDYVINTALQSGLIIERDVNETIPTIDQIFAAFAFAFGKCRTIAKGTAAQFHGDIADSDIDVIDIASFLPNGFDSERAEMVIEQILARTEEIRAGIGFESESTLFFLCIRSLGAPDRILRGLGPVLAALRCVTSHADEIGFRLVAQLDAIFSESLVDGVAGDIESFGQFKHAHASLIERANLLIRQILATVQAVIWARDGESSGADVLGQIIGVTADSLGTICQGSALLEHFDCVVDNVIGEDTLCHVYNLENKMNWYTANNIIIHNCRCVFQPVIRFEDM